MLRYSEVGIRIGIDVFEYQSGTLSAHIRQLHSEICRSQNGGFSPPVFQQHNGVFSFWKILRFPGFYAGEKIRLYNGKTDKIASMRHN